MKHKIEIFTADCPLCLNTLKAVKKSTEECGCKVIEYRCKGEECCRQAKNYNIRAVPSVVVDGKVVHIGKLSAEEFRKHI